MARRGYQRSLALAWVMQLWIAAPSAAITIQIDYRYDSTAFGGTNFFGSGNPQGGAAGTQAKAALEAAAGYFSTILADTFSAITLPSPYHSTAPGSTGVVTWNWQQQFQHPSSSVANEVSVTNPVVGNNQYVIYAGAANMSGDRAGEGGAGGFFRPSPTITGTNSFTSSDISQINSLTANLDSAIVTRGEPNGFAGWGGTISFDRSDRNWHFNHNTSPSGGVTDFYSVAIHELAHALGFGNRDNDPAHVTEWESFISGSSFYGSTAISSYSTPVPLATSQPDPQQNYSHWAPGTSSTIHGSSIAQEAAMDPDLNGAVRKHFTTLDAAAMVDIGWTVVAPPAPANIVGDYNNNGIVDAADFVIYRKRLGQSVTIPNDETPGTVTSGDYTVWRRNFGKSPGGGSASGVPEPASGTLFLLACLVSYCRRRGRNGFRDRRDGCVSWFEG